MLLDIRILELLSSKICHDLVSPVGAINNGVELIEDIGGDVVEEAMQLIRSSAEQASRRLRLFRLAYGRAGSDGNLTFRDTRDTILAHFEGGKIKAAFADDFPLAAFAETRGALKAMINLALLAEETLVYGGTIAFANGTGAFAAGAVLTVSGRNAALSEAAQQTLDGAAAVDDVTPRTVHAYVTGKFLGLHNLKYAVETPQPETIAIQYAAQEPHAPAPEVP